MMKRVIDLLKNYRENKAELEILSLGLDLKGIDYSRDSVQTSNISNLDDIIIARETRKAQLQKDIKTVEVLIDSLDVKHKYVIESLYVKGYTYLVTGAKIGISTENGVDAIRKKAIENTSNLLKRIEGLGRD